VAARKRASVEERADALQPAADDPEAPGSPALIEEGLADKSWFVVARAADIVAQHPDERHREALERVWSRFADGSHKSDPGCRAKLAALTALDRLDLLDPEPFLPATRYRQHEPAFGGRSETAGTLRVRAVSALLRMRYSDALVLAGELLAEAERDVRAGVAQSLGYFALPGSDALLAHRLAVAGEEPVVLGECAQGLLRLNLEYALARLVTWLDGEDLTLREVASMALGQHEDDRAIGALTDWVERCAMEADIALGVQALGLSRQPRARGFLLELVRSGSLGRARAAIRALSVHHYDAQLRESVRRALAEGPHDELAELVEDAFRPRAAH
jgi:HEAT repeat protein